MMPISFGTDRSIIRPLRFIDKFLEKRGPDVEKFFIYSLQVEMIFCMFGN